MPTLQKIPGVLTVGEAEERLKKNPDDPDPQVQQYKKSLEKFAAIWQPRINADMALARTSALGVLQDTSLLSSIRVVNESLSKMVFPMKVMMDSLRFPYLSMFNRPTLFGEGLASLGFGSVAKEASDVVQKHNSQLDKITEIINQRTHFEMPRITHFPPSPAMVQAQLRGDIQELRELIEEKMPIQEAISVINGIDLVSRIPRRGKKYKTPQKVAGLFQNTLRVDNFELIRQIKPTIIGNNRNKRKISKRDYYAVDKKADYDGQIKNVLKYLNKIAHQIGYTLKFHKEYVEAVLFEKDN